jgi:hypothetical protein
MTMDVVVEMIDVFPDVRPARDEPVWMSAFNP